MLAGILVIGGMEMVLVKMSKNKPTGAVWGLIYCCASSSILPWAEITDWLESILIKIKPPYDLKDLGDYKVVFLLYPVNIRLVKVNNQWVPPLIKVSLYVASICNSSPFTFVKRNIFFI